MKKSFTIFISLFLGLGMWAQKNNVKTLKSPDRAAMQMERNIYNHALDINDYGVAINSMYRLIEMDTSDKTLRDTLCLLYYTAGAAEQSILLADDILSHNPDNMLIRQLSAISKQKAGLIAESLTDYQLLYNYNHKIKDLYQIATLQYNLKRFGECLTSCEKILQDPGISSIEVVIAVSEKEKQNVNLAAAVFNIKGMIALEMNHLEEARSFFNKSLEISKNQFLLPKNALEYLKEQEKDNKTP